MHTFNGKDFGEGNLGERGIKKFLETHRCNAICTYLRLPAINPKPNFQTPDSFRFNEKKKIKIKKQIREARAISKSESASDLVKQSHNISNFRSDHLGKIQEEKESKDCIVM